MRKLQGMSKVKWTDNTQTTVRQKNSEPRKPYSQEQTVEATINNA